MSRTTRNIITIRLRKLYDKWEPLLKELRWRDYPRDYLVEEDHIFRGYWHYERGKFPKFERNYAHRRMRRSIKAALRQGDESLYYRHLPKIGWPYD